MGAPGRASRRLLPSLFIAALSFRTETCRSYTWVDGGGWSALTTSSVDAGEQIGRLSQICKLSTAECYTGRWDECGASLSSHISDHNGTRHYKPLSYALPQPRTLLSNSQLRGRRSICSWNYDIESRLCSASILVDSVQNTGFKLSTVGDWTRGRSWVWQRQFSTESESVPASKEGLQESHIGQELLTEVDEQSSKSGSASLEGLQLADGEELSPEDAAILKEAEAEYEAAQKGKEQAVSVESLQEMLLELQAIGDPKDIRVAIISLRLGQEYEAKIENPETFLKHGKQALEIFEAAQSFSAETGMCHHLIASAYHKMGLQEQSLENLNKALSLLEDKEGKDFAPVKFAVHFLFGDTLSALGKHEQALQHYVTGLAVQETILGDSHPQLATNYRQVGEAFTQVMLFDEAKVLVDRALEIHLKNHGEGSIDEAIDRRLLAVIFSGLEEHEKALNEQQTVKTILREKNFGSEAVFVEIAMADTQVTLGRFDDAIASLQSAMSHLEDGSSMRVLAMVNLAKAYAQQGNQDEAKVHAREALSILETKLRSLSGEPTESLAVAECFTELAAIYERMNQPEEAISLLKKALSVFQQLPAVQLNAVAGSQAQIGMLLSFTGKVKEAIPYMEEAVKNLRQSFGDGHFSLALVLNHLAVAEVELENLTKAVDLFEEAKSILTKTHGPGQQDTLSVYHNLMKVYMNLGRKEEAIANARHIVFELEKQGDGVEGALSEAQKDLAELEDHGESAPQEGTGQLTEPMKLQGGD